MLPPSADPAHCVKQILNAASEYRIAEYERLLARASFNFEPAAFTYDVVAPLLREAGDRWHQGELSIVQEHLVSSAARRQLWRLLDQYGQHDLPATVAFTTLRGERHEMGSLMLAVVTAARGFGAIYLGADLPAEEIGRFCRHVRVAACAISIVTVPEVLDVYLQLGALRRALPESTEIWLGGQACSRLAPAQLPSQTRILQTLQEYEETLASLNAETADHD